jgi:hypothetical protein
MSIITAWQCISPDVIVKGCKNACTPTAMDESDNDMLWNGWKRMGMLGVSVRKMKALTEKMEIVTLIGKSAENEHALRIKRMKLRAKYFFLADILVVVGHLKFGYLGGPS